MSAAQLHTASVQHRASAQAADAELQSHLVTLDKQDVELQNTLVKIASLKQNPNGIVDVAAYPQGCQVWLPDEGEIWLKATCYETGDAAATFRLENGDFVVVKAGKRPRTVSIQPEGGKPVSFALPEGDGLPAQNVGQVTLSQVNDLTKLAHLHEPAILHFLGSRFLEGLIYTRTGAILIAINPWRWLPGIYDAKEMDKYHAATPVDAGLGLAPHIFATAAEAYANVQAGNSQSILVSGESGAGKTETCKQLIKFFARVAGSPTPRTPGSTPGSSSTRRQRTLSLVGGQTVGIEQRVISCNPLMETFGNASTPRNNNSSRFGKFTLMGFSVGALVGATIETYLLEKSRVVAQDPGNRNFHIFFQLCSTSSAGGSMASELGLRRASSHALTRGPDMMQESTEQDGLDFDETRKGLATIGVGAEDQLPLFQALAAIIHLGDVTFQDSDGAASIIGSPEQTDHPLSYAVRLLQCDGTLLSNALVSREMHVGSDVTLVALRGEQAAEARDSLCKALYAKIFDYIVHKTNASFSGVQGSGPSATVGLLDIFGFEYFGADNSFEQLCINFANEKIQQVFNAHVFKLEQKEYERERINYKDISFTDNQNVLDIFDGTPHSQGFFKLLDEQCKLPNASDDAFLSRWCEDLKGVGEPVLAPHRFGGGHFVIRHFAAPVTYSVQGFMSKNRDNLHPDLIPAVQSSSSHTIRALFPQSMKHRALSMSGGGGSGRGSSKNSKLFTATVGSQFAGQLKGMMEQIMATELHFIRCLNPNAQKRPSLFDNSYVVDQVRCNGLLDAVHVMREMYGTRILHAHFFGTYTQPEWLPLLRATAESRAVWERLPKRPSNFDVLRDACSQLCISLGLCLREHFQIGRSKVFLRTGVVANLGHNLVECTEAAAARIQSRVRGRQQRLRYQRERAAALVIERAERRHAAQLELRALKLAKMQAMERQEFLRREAEAVALAEQREVERRNNAATRIAAARRGQLVRRVNRIQRSVGLLEEKDQLLQQLVTAREEAEAESEKTGSLELQLAKLREQLLAATTALESEKADKSVLQKTHAELAADYDVVTRELDGTNQQLDAKGRELAFTQEQNSLLKDQLAGKGSSLADLTVAKAEIEDSLHLEKENAFALNVRIDALINDLETSELEVQSLTGQLEGAKSCGAALQVALEQSQAEVAHETAEIRVLEKTGRRLTAQLELANNQVQLLQLRAQEGGSGGRGRVMVKRESQGRSAIRMATSAAARAAVQMPARIDMKDDDVNVDDVRAVLSDPRTIMSGFMEKRKKSVSSWKRRWFVLKRNSLLYYKDESMQVLKGLIWTESLRVESRTYLPEKKGFFSGNKDDDRRVNRPVLMLADGGKVMYVMLADEEISAGLNLAPWFNQIKKVVARASYIKKEEALDKEPDSRVLNYIDDCADLETMDLSHMEVGLEAAVAVGQCLPFAVKLTAMQLVGGLIDDLQLSQLALPLSNNSASPGLTAISLKDNAISSDGAKHIVAMLTGRSGIEINLSGNSIGRSTEGCVHVAAMIHGGALISLDLSDNGCTDEGIALVCAAALDPKCTVTSLDLSSNPLRGVGANHVAEMLRANHSLTDLKLANCGLSDKAAQELAEALCVNTMLTKLDVSGNSITNDGAATFVTMLDRNHTLQKITLAGNVLANFVPPLPAGTSEGGPLPPVAVVTVDQLIKASPSTTNDTSC